MKNLFCNKFTYLTLFCVLLTQTLQAQGAENAIRALEIFTIFVAGFGFLALIVLIVFIINRGKVMAIISGAFGCVMLLAGCWFSYTLSRGDVTDFDYIPNNFWLAGSANLALVFALRIIFPRKTTVQAGEENVAEQPLFSNPKTPLTIKWISLLLILWFFFSLRDAIGFLETVLNWNEFSVIQPPEIYMVVIGFVMVILLVAALVLFIRQKRMGWNLLVFYTFYTLIGFLFFVARNAFFSAGAKFNTPTSIYLTQLFIVIFLSVCIWLLTTASTRNVFAVSTRSFRRTLLVSIAGSFALLFLSNGILALLS